MKNEKCQAWAVRLNYGILLLSVVLNCMVGLQMLQLHILTCPNREVQNYSFVLVQIRKYRNAHFQGYENQCM